MDDDGVRVDGGGGDGRNDDGDDYGDSDGGNCDNDDGDHVPSAH